MAGDESTHDDVLQQNHLEGGEDGAAVQHWIQEKRMLRQARAALQSLMVPCMLMSAREQRDGLTLQLL